MTHRIAATILLALATLVGSACTTLPVGPRDPGSRDTHVDCSASVADPDGSPERPYTNLVQVNELTFGRDDHLLFRRGSTCHGMLRPRGEGTPEQPWVIDDYGDAGGRARIDGDGFDNAVLLQNVQGVVVRDLELTNAGNPGTDRRGLQVLLDNYGAGRFYVIENLYIHDIVGSPEMGPGASDGILFSIVGGDRPSWFEGVLVEGNVVNNVDYGGIRVGPSVWHDRPESGSTTLDMPWTPHVMVMVRENFVSNVGGDGIVLDNTRGGVVEDNRVAGFHLRSSGYYAGIWTIGSDGTVIQRNHITGGRTTIDGYAIDSDIGSVGTVVQYNYSADNEGGFMLLCSGRDGGGAVVRDTVVRYNVSQNDQNRGVGLCHGAIENTRIYNNTFYVGPNRSMVVVEDTDEVHDVAFTNNIVVKQGPGWAYLWILGGTGTTVTSSLFTNVAGAPDEMVRDPLLVAPGTATGPGDLDGYRVRAGSPALGAATPIPGNGGRDVFGGVVAEAGPANIGAYEGPGV
ncbi:MAG TPA: right-handed parallel beta-helix repeat-containing protein [Acidimicrobiales bacterium]